MAIGPPTGNSLAPASPQPVFHQLPERQVDSHKQEAKTDQKEKCTYPSDRHDFPLEWTR